MKLNVYGIIGLICGIIGLLLSCIYIGMLPALIGLAFSLLGLSQKNAKYGTSIAGLACSISALFIGLLMIFISIINLESEVEQTTQSSVAESSVEVIQSSEDVEEVVESETESEPVIEETEEEYKASCQEYNYKNVLRNPEDYVGKRIKITVKISSVHEKSLFNDTKYYFAYDDESGYGYFVGNRYGIFDNREDESLKLLQDDIITVYGEILDPEYTSSLIVTSTEVFCIDMKYLDFISE